MRIKGTENMDMAVVIMVVMTTVFVASTMYLIFDDVVTTKDPQFKQVFAESYAKCTNIKHTSNDSCLRLARTAAYASMHGK